VRRSLAIKSPHGRTVVPVVRDPSHRDCLMAQVGRCRLSFPFLDNERRLMCSEHWKHLSDDQRAALLAGFDAVIAAHTLWVECQRAALDTVVKATTPAVTD
jgi:hypothetical protein